MHLNIKKKKKTLKLAALTHQLIRRIVISLKPLTLEVLPNLYVLIWSLIISYRWQLAAINSCSQVPVNNWALPSFCPRLPCSGTQVSISCISCSCTNWWHQVLLSDSDVSVTTRLVFLTKDIFLWLWPCYIVPFEFDERPFPNSPVAWIKLAG